jgi:NADPH:quinone reductase
MPQQVRGVVVDPAAPGKLAIKPVELRDPDRDEVAVQVTAISLNRGETRRAIQQAEPGWRPGWDFAGVVGTAAADGSGPKPGTRVVGILPSGAWAERVNCRTHAVAALPEAVGDAEAATLPVAGLTALHALRQGGLLLGRKVLVDGASGGSGISPASSLRRPARRSGAMCAGRNIAPPLPNGAANGSCSAANSSPPSRTGRSG